MDTQKILRKEYGEMGKKLCAQGKPDKALEVYEEAEKHDLSVNCNLYKIITRSLMTMNSDDLLKLSKELDTEIYKMHIANKPTPSSW
jgi:pentatricopeptide repeat protein